MSLNGILIIILEWKHSCKTTSLNSTNIVSQNFEITTLRDCKAAPLKHF